MGSQAGPDGSAERLGGGQAALGPAQVEVGPGFIEEAEIELVGDLGANGVLHLREVEHHAVGIERAAHGHDQLIVVAVARGEGAGPEAGPVVVVAELRQPVAVAGAEGGPAGDHTGPALAMGTTTPRGHRRAAVGVAGLGVAEGRWA